MEKILDFTFTILRVPCIKSPLNILCMTFPPLCFLYVNSLTCRFFISSLDRQPSCHSTSATFEENLHKWRQYHILHVNGSTLAWDENVNINRFLCKSLINSFFCCCCCMLKGLACHHKNMWLMSPSPSSSSSSRATTLALWKTAYTSAYVDKWMYRYLEIYLNKSTQLFGIIFTSFIIIILYSIHFFAVTESVSQMFNERKKS